MQTAALAELTNMILVSALEDSFEIAWSFLEKSGELRGAAESANIILDSIEQQQLRTGERRKLMLANRQRWLPEPGEDAARGSARPCAKGRRPQTREE
jgi:hypothetical protein